ncbi:hypothetical protein ACFY5D_22120 [Paeniglutamicibacter sp. NPDC012692]|uniref:hypothetical protein n=1 Tax=Paeniglutamicibacter sp. NPDC012692 TaxID=3364388 RepID=UPI0036C6495E
MNLQQLTLNLCLALTPTRQREVRREQWGADLRDAHSLGMNHRAVLIGAATAALHLRASHIIMSTQGIGSFSKGKNMKTTMIAIFSTLTLAGAAVVGAQAFLPAKDEIPVINIDGLLESVEHPDDVYIYSDTAGSGTLAD